MSILKNKNFNKILLILFSIATIYFLYLCFVEPEYLLINIAAVLIGIGGIIITYNDVKKPSSAAKSENDF
jgi:hypothetical protein